MKQEIKERIEKIRKGEVPEGYKKTKIGIVPKDWDIDKLGNIGNFKNGINKSKEDFGDGIPFVNLMDVFGKPFFNGKKLSLVKANKKEIVEYSLLKGDVLFVRSSVKPEGVGLTTVILDDLRNTVYSGFLIRFRSINSFDCNFKKYCFFENNFRKRVLSVSSISANTNINQDSLNKLEIQIPTFVEQNKIASILSTWDKAIELKEKLIEQKKELKRGLMQKLLTGEVRFPGFNDEWKILNLGDKLKFVKKEPLINPNEYKLLTVKLHLQGVEPTSTHPKITENGRPYYIREEGEILIGRQNFHNGGIGLVPKNADGYIASNAISSLKSSDGNQLFYLFYLSNPNLFKKVGHLIGGTGQKEISESMLSKLKIKIPNTKKEISKITSILKLCDESLRLEIDSLERLKQQKKGLMQLLLTGIVRVNTGEDDELSKDK